MDRLSFRSLCEIDEEYERLRLTKCFPKATETSSTTLPEELCIERIQSEREQLREALWEQLTEGARHDGEMERVVRNLEHMKSGDAWTELLAGTEESDILQCNTDALQLLCEKKPELAASVESALRKIDAHKRQWRFLKKQKTLRN